ncbi:MAG: single-stranded-DNA-specific exonuclease RecJ [Chitinophagales bacterium]|nr:single-stranded-DNA-specific exonuclease RecJ [Chitinophagales bacterium]
MSVNKRWIYLEADENKVAHLQEVLKINPILCKLLVLRGITTFEEAENFFRPKLEQLHNPFLMKDMDKAIDRIEKAMTNNEKVLIYGDYDVDGTTSVALVYSYFINTYTNLEYYIPDRYTEGYGISLQGIDYAAENNFSLIIALDCGIKAREQVDYAKSKNIDFIICDHHLPDETLPNAVAILNPKQKDCTYPYKDLSGCGIGFKLAQAYAEKHQLDKTNLNNQLDLVATSIASDLVPITGENRILAKFGVEQVNKAPRAGIKALLKELKLNRKLEISDLVFIIGPRINAAGRIAHGSEAVELLIAKNLTEAFTKIKKVQQNNDNRKEMDKSITDEAFAILKNNDTYKNRKSTVLYQEHWHKGVIGIVASRLIEKYHKPTVILAASNGKAVGSARSVPGFDLHDAIEQCADLLEKFGGHKYAAGLTIEIENIPAFIEKFENIVASNIKDEMLITPIEIDAEIELSDINEKFFNIIQQMAPFGPQNMQPTFVTKNVYDTGFSKIVKKEHLKISIMKDADNPINGIGFGMAYLYKNIIQQKDTFDICYHLCKNSWNGQEKIELRIKDIQ